jgi:hypothetical protein
MLLCGIRLGQYHNKAEDVNLCLWCLSPQPQLGYKGQPEVLQGAGGVIACMKGLHSGEEGSLTWKYQKKERFIHLS